MIMMIASVSQGSNVFSQEKKYNYIYVVIAILLYVLALIFIFMLISEIFKHHRVEEQKKKALSFVPDEMEQVIHKYDNTNFICLSIGSALCSILAIALTILLTKTTSELSNTVTPSSRVVTDNNIIADNIVLNREVNQVVSSRVVALDTSIAEEVSSDEILKKYNIEDNEDWFGSNKQAFIDLLKDNPRKDLISSIVLAMKNNINSKIFIRILNKIYNNPTYLSNLINLLNMWSSLNSVLKQQITFTLQKDSVAGLALVDSLKDKNDIITFYGVSDISTINKLLKSNITMKDLNNVSKYTFNLLLNLDIIYKNINLEALDLWISKDATTKTITSNLINKNKDLMITLFSCDKLDSVMKYTSVSKLNSWLKYQKSSDLKQILTDNRVSGILIAGIINNNCSVQTIKPYLNSKFVSFVNNNKLSVETFLQLIQGINSDAVVGYEDYILIVINNNIDLQVVKNIINSNIQSMKIISSLVNKLQLQSSYVRDLQQLDDTQLNLWLNLINNTSTNYTKLNAVIKTYGISQVNQILVSQGLDTFVNSIK